MASFDQVMVKLAAKEDVFNLEYYKEKVEKELGKRVRGLKGIFVKRKVLSEIKSLNELKDLKSVDEDVITNFLFKAEKIFDDNGIDSSNIEYMEKEVTNHSRKIRDRNINQWTGFFKYILYHLVDDIVDEFENNSKKRMEHTHRYLSNLISAYKPDFNESILNRGFLEYFGVFEGIGGKFSKSHLAEYVIKNSVKIKRMLNDPDVKISQKNKDEMIQFLSTIGYVWDIRSGSEIDNAALDKMTFLGQDFVTYIDADLKLGTITPKSVTEIPKYILLRHIVVKLRKLPENNAYVKMMLNSIGLFSLRNVVVNEFHNDKFNAFAKKYDVSLHDIISPIGEGVTRLTIMMTAAAKSNDLDDETRVLFDKVVDEIKSVNSAYNRYVKGVSNQDVDDDDDALSHCLSSIKEALRVIGYEQKTKIHAPQSAPKETLPEERPESQKTQKEKSVEPANSPSVKSKDGDIEGIVDDDDL